MTSTNPLAGKPAPPSMLVDLPRLITAYFSERPDPSVATQRVAFGTSGHRGVSFQASFNEAHVLAMPHCNRIVHIDSSTAAPKCAIFC